MQVVAHCPECGEVCLSRANVKVRVCADDSTATMCFRCPSCRRATAQPISPEKVRELDAAGVPASVWHLPAELSEPPAGPPLTYDDLLDFMLELHGQSAAR